MSLFAEFHFLRPWWLLALLLVPFIGWLWRQRRHQAGNWQSVIDAHLLPHLVDHDAERASQGHVWLAATLVVIACIALAGPAWERQSLPLLRNDAARILAIELAPTMLAADVKPTRLERARYKVNDILVASRDMQTALIGYSGDAFVAAPLTDDVNTVRNLIDALSPGIMPVVGNNAERAIAEALKLMQQAGLEQGELILLADSVGDRAVDAARAARAQGLRISVLGVGSANGAPVPLPQGGFLQDADGNIVLPRLDEPELRALAQAGGGRYATLSADRSDLDILLDLRGGESTAASGEGNAVSSERYLDRGVWLLLLLLPLALLAFRRGWLMLLPLTLLAPIPPAQAMEWIDLWQRPDQQAANALADGDVERARNVARDPLWRGSAEYRAGEFASAAQAFASASGAQALYNQGNALARAARYEEAIDAYRRALDVDSTLEDAEANKKAVEDWLKRPQSQQQKTSRTTMRARRRIRNPHRTIPPPIRTRNKGNAKARHPIPLNPVRMGTRSSRKTRTPPKAKRGPTHKTTRQEPARMLRPIQRIRRILPNPVWDGMPANLRMPRKPQPTRKVARTSKRAWRRPSTRNWSPLRKANHRRHRRRLGKTKLRRNNSRRTDNGCNGCPTIRAAC